MSNLSAPTVSGSHQLVASITANQTTTTSTTITTRNNVSVTNIKCEVDEMAAANASNNGNVVSFYNGSSTGSIRIPVTKTEDDSDSDAELANIENLQVTRRVYSNSTHNDAAGGGSGLGLGLGLNTTTQYNKNGPRPMSWEGELSETETTETELMETENSCSNGPIALSIPAATSSMMLHHHHHQQQQQATSMGVAVIKSEASTTTSAMVVAAPTTAVIRPSLSPSSSSSTSHIKPEIDQQHISVEILNNTSSSIYAPHHTKLKLASTQSDPINLKYETNDAAAASPLLQRNRSTTLPLPANPSPDSAIHSVYTHSSPSQSPLTSRHAPCTPSLSRNNSDASHSSCYSYSSEFSPTHSPIQARHAPPAIYGNFNGSLHHSILYRPISVDNSTAATSLPNAVATNATTAIDAPQNLSMDSQTATTTTSATSSLGIGADGLPASPAGISRQQLINSPCPICGDKISGFHYGIFSCESCKGFFKRTVQNRKNYVCVRGGPCPVSISTRKKCPACRFEKCLQKGMKLEAIREDRTRGGRSTYQCSYTLPNSMLSPLLSPDQQNATAAAAGCQQPQQQQQRLGQATTAGGLFGYHSNGSGGGGAGSMNGYNSLHSNIKTEQYEIQNLSPSTPAKGDNKKRGGNVPVLLQEIMDVEHLWQYNEAELARLNQPLSSNSSSGGGSGCNATSSNDGAGHNQQMTNPLLASAGLSSNGENANPDLIAHLCNVADHRLYKIVKWCKSLPLFKNISIDDQICLLINSWCELLLFSCCFRSVDSPGEIKLSQGKKVNLAQAKSNGLQACIERMLNLTDHLRRLRVDRYEYVAMKVIVLLQSDTSELQEPVKVRECQEKALQSLQAYTLANYPDSPSKFGELLLRIPELQRTCQLGKEMLTIKSRDGGNADFNLLMELLRGEH